LAKFFTHKHSKTRKFYIGKLTRHSLRGIILLGYDLARQARLFLT